MEKKRGIFFVKRLHFSNFLDLDLYLKIFWTVFGLRLSFKKSALELDRKI